MEILGLWERYTACRFPCYFWTEWSIFMKIGYENYAIGGTKFLNLTWCFSDRASWIDYILITNLMYQLLFIHKIIFSSKCFEPQVLIFRRIQLYSCSIWYCHSLWEFVVACRYTAWVRTDCRGKVVGECLKTPTNNLSPTISIFSTYFRKYILITNFDALIIIYS